MERMGARHKLFHRADVLHGKCSDAPSIVEAVQFHGVRLTKGDALLKEVAHLYKSTTLDKLVTNSHLAAKHLQEVGLMENASAFIDTTSSANGYVVNFVVKEPKSFTLGAKLGMSTQGDADMSLNAAKHNLHGRGEMADAAYTYTVKGDHSFHVSGSKPLLGWQRYENIGASLSRSFAYLPWNKANLEENALIFSFNRYFGNRMGLFSAKLNSVWRTLRATPDCAFALREQAGHTLKMSYEHAVAVDTRDKPILATKGILARLSQEVAGFGGLGDAQFHRHQIDLQAAAPLFSHLILAASLQARVIEATSASELHLLDRLYIGGQHDIRGFALNSVGVSSDGCCLGGGASVAGAIHLLHPLRPADSLFAHAFLASGALSPVRSRTVMRDLRQSQRVSAGVGLIFAFRNIFRLELNYVHPLKFAPGDSFQRGIHFGAGVNFL